MIKQCRKNWIYNILILASILTISVSFYPNIIAQITISIITILIWYEISSLDFRLNLLEDKMKKEVNLIKKGTDKQIESIWKELEKKRNV